MAIVYIHGVANRKDDPAYSSGISILETLLMRYVAPAIGTTTVRIAYWGDYGTHFSWDGSSRPRTLLRGQGTRSIECSDAERSLLVASTAPGLDWPAEEPAPIAVEMRGLVPAGPDSSISPGPKLRMKDLSAEVLSDLLSTTVVSTVVDDAILASLLIEVDEIAHAPTTADQLARCRNADEELTVLRGLLETVKPKGLTAQGSTWVLSAAIDRLGETLSRIDNIPAFVLSTVAAEWRPKLNGLVTLFLGDVFEYLKNRGSASKPGPIPLAVMKVMQDAKQASTQGEPLVVVTHSMGGQIMYDLVTTFLPSFDSSLRVDFWCATASQVGLFEEMKLFESSLGAYSKANKNKCPFPDRKYLGLWWNVWDHSDLLSYTCAPIFEDVDDEPFNSGVSLVEAHSAYLLRPSFHRRLGRKLQEARKVNWRRPDNAKA
jgi:hypothetical protein